MMPAASHALETSTGTRLMVQGACHYRAGSWLSPWRPDLAGGYHREMDEQTTDISFMPRPARVAYWWLIALTIGVSPLWAAGLFLHIRWLVWAAGVPMVTAFAAAWLLHKGFLTWRLITKVRDWQS